MRTLAVLGGVSAFVLADALTVREWAVLGGRFQPWFLNSGGAVALTAGLCAAAAAIAAGVDRRAPFIKIAALNAAGAFAASLVVIVVRVGGGNLFPIVVVLDALVLLASSAAGAGVVRLAFYPWAPRTHRS
jgi:hypothetical protein